MDLPTILDHDDLLVEMVNRVHSEAINVANHTIAKEVIYLYYD